MKNKSVDNSLSQIAVSVHKIILSSDDMEGAVKYAKEIQPELANIWKLLGLTQAQELLLELTRLLDEHPEGWDGDCECTECLMSQ